MPQAILLQDVESLGERGTVVDVSPGYLRNFLLPRKLAEPATHGSIEAATRRREQAEQEHEGRRQRAASAEKQRKEASRNVEDRVEEHIEETAPEKQLEALETQAAAQREREEALTVHDEAQRLGDAAAAVKDERKES